MQVSGLNEPPAPLSVHDTIPIIVEEGFFVSAIVIVNGTCTPTEKVTGFGVMVAVVGSSAFADN